MKRLFGKQIKSSWKSALKRNRVKEDQVEFMDSDDKAFPDEDFKNINQNEIVGYISAILDPTP